MDERDFTPHRRNADQKIDALYEALLGNFTKRGVLDEMRESIASNTRTIEALERRMTKHEMEQQERDERSEEGKRELRQMLFGIAERGAVALVGALGGAWVAIQAFWGSPHHQ